MKLDKNCLEFLKKILNTHSVDSNILVNIIGYKATVFLRDLITQCKLHSNNTFYRKHVDITKTTGYKEYAIRQRRSELVHYGILSYQDRYINGANRVRYYTIHLARLIELMGEEYAKEYNDIIEYIVKSEAVAKEPDLSEDEIGTAYTLSEESKCTDSSIEYKQELASIQEMYSKKHDKDLVYNNQVELNYTILRHGFDFTADGLETAVRNYLNINHGKDPKYIKHLANFLNIDNQYEIAKFMNTITECADVVLSDTARRNAIKIMNSNVYTDIKDSFEYAKGWTVPVEKQDKRFEKQYVNNVVQFKEKLLNRLGLGGKKIIEQYIELNNIDTLEKFTTLNINDVIDYHIDLQVK